MTVIVVMGVAGSGKTTVGGALADRLGVPYAEADSFHPKANIEKMASGHPLDDADRAPWLRAIAAWIGAHEAGGGVVSSSALKRRYRDVLRTGGDVWFLHLDGPRDVLAERMKSRTGHFMPPSLLDSQLADLQPLEPGEHGLVADITQSPGDIVEAALTALAKEPK
ncbi:gluconokinase [Amycolatopsis acidicola]|uniref:Gluconokinase n=1 Tax=Amycolatopsis acidicola TaxID=2596893 RepID=A0A5N0UP98_9PSEU|nr:gluconokinase [Amycolatopsis acidicola]KAA9152821.1 gluconokinase [Amycolatopsis acidicola]